MEYRLGKDRHGALTLFASPIEVTNAKSIDQYGSHEGTEDTIASIHRHEAVDKEELFSSGLGHFSEPSTALQSVSDPSYPKLLRQWRLYARVVRKKTPFHCICSKKVTDLRFIRNIKNGNVLLMGVCCLNRYIEGSPLVDDNDQFNQLVEKACRSCNYLSTSPNAGEDGEACTVISYAPEMHGPYCGDCYEKLGAATKQQLRKKKYCACCFKLRSISPRHNLCDQCHADGEKPLIKDKEIKRGCESCGETMEVSEKETWRRLCNRCYQDKRVKMICRECEQSYHVMKGQEWKVKCYKCCRTDQKKKERGDDKMAMSCESCQKSYRVKKGEEWKKVCVQCYRTGIW